MNFTCGTIVDMLFDFGPLGMGYRSRLGGHAVCIIGAYSNNDQVIVHDPWTGPYKTHNFSDLKSKVDDLTWLHKVGTKEMSESSTPWMS